METHEPLGIDPDTPCFWCNTNRQRPPDEGGSDAQGRFRLERLMHANNCAASWLQFQYQDHMQLVREASIILMYAKRVGIIGVGQATGPVQCFTPAIPGGSTSRKYRLCGPSIIHIPARSGEFRWIGSAGGRTAPVGGAQCWCQPA